MLYALLQNPAQAANSPIIFGSVGGITCAYNILTQACIPTSSGSGANTSLSNLASTAINVDLIPGAANTINLGSNADPFNNLITNTIEITLANNTSVGTVINQPAALLTSTSTVTKAQGGSFANNVLGIVTGNAGTSGNATIAIAGKVNCTFTSTAAPGQYAGIDTSNGKCNNAGFTPPAFIQVIGKIISGSGTTGLVEIAPYIPSISSVLSPLATNGSGQLQIPFTLGAVAFGGAFGILGKDANAFFFDDTNGLLGVGGTSFLTNPPVATVDAIGNGSTFTPAPSAVTVTLVQANNPSNVGSASALQVGPRISGPTSPTGFQDDSTASCGPAAGSNYLYSFWAFDGTKWNTVPTLLNITDNSDSSTFKWDLTLNPPTFGNATDYYYCVSVNSGPLQCNDLMGTPSSFTDDCSSYSFSSAPTPQYGDFVANGTTYNFNAVGVFTSPSGGLYYSGTPLPFGFTDDNTGNAFSISVTTAVATGAPFNEIGDGGPTLSYGNTDSSGNLPIYGDGTTTSYLGTPTQFGFQADGSTLTNNFITYGTQSYLGKPYFSSSLNNSGTTDPNDNLFYYYNLSIPTGNANYKIINSNASVGAFNNHTNNVFDALSIWTDGTTVLPNTFKSPAGSFEVNNSQTDPTNTAFTPNLVLPNLNSAGVETIQAQDQSGANHGYVQFSSSQVGFIPPGGSSESLYTNSSGNTGVSANLNVAGSAFVEDQLGVGISSGGAFALFVNNLTSSFPVGVFKGASSQSGDYIQILNSSSARIFAIDAAVHVVAPGNGAPSATPNANLGTSGTCAVSHASDVAGSVTLSVGTGISIAAGAECAIGFNQAYAAAPICVLYPATSVTALAAIAPYATSSTSALTVNFGAAGITATTYVFNYHCIQTN